MKEFVFDAALVIPADNEEQAQKLAAVVQHKLTELMDSCPFPADFSVDIDSVSCDDDDDEDE